jgi:hypothetical protein
LVEDILPALAFKVGVFDYEVQGDIELIDSPLDKY